MSKILSQEEIDAVLKSISTGKPVNAEKIRKKKKVSLYDFKRPSLISKDQMRLLESVHSGFARDFSVFLSTQLRMIVDIDLLGVDQVMYSEFLMSIVPPSALYVGIFDEPTSKFVVEIEPQFALFVVERLLGGEGNFASVKRPLSLIEQRVMQKIMSYFASSIAKNWKILKDFRSCSFTQFESDPEFVQIVPASEPTIVISFEMKVHKKTTPINICYPYIWISDIISRPEVQEKILYGSQRSSTNEREILKRNLHSTYVDLRAVLGKAFISVRDLIDLQVGDVIVLDSRVGSEIPVFVQNYHLFDAISGKKSNNYAFQIQTIYTERRG